LPKIITKAKVVKIYNRNKSFSWFEKFSKFVVMEDIKEITPQTYAKWYGCKPQYIHRLLKSGDWAELPLILKVKRYSRFYVLEVPKTFGKDSYKEIIAKNVN
jgi:hypothetical protein